MAQGAWDTPFDSANTHSVLYAPSAKDRRDHGAGGGGTQDSLCRTTSGRLSVPWGGVEGGLSGGHRGQEDASPAKGTAHRGALAIRGKVCILCQGQWGSVAVWGSGEPNLGKEHSNCLGENGQVGSPGKVTTGSQVWQGLTGEGLWVPGVQAELLRRKELDLNPAGPLLEWPPSLTHSPTAQTARASPSSGLGPGLGY